MSPTTTSGSARSRRSSRSRPGTATGSTSSGRVPAETSSVSPDGRSTSGARAGRPGRRDERDRAAEPRDRSVDRERDRSARGGGGGGTTPPAPAGPRDGPGWAFAWPSVIVEVETEDDESEEGGGGTIARDELEGGGGAGGSLEENLRADQDATIGQRVRPVRTRDFDEDLRFIRKRPGRPDWESRFPKDWPGIVTAATEEHAQLDLWHPDSAGIVAVGHAGSARLSTRVFDLDGESRVDPERWAHAHTFWRVVRPRGGVPSYGSRTCSRG